MIKSKTRMKRLIAEQEAAIRIHDGMSAALLEQLTRAHSAFVTSDDVVTVIQTTDKLVMLSRLLCDEIGTDASEAALNTVLGSDVGMARATQVWQLQRETLQRCAGTQMLLGDVLVGPTLDDQSVVQQYLALCSQAAALVYTQLAMFRMCHAQFHVFDERFGLIGQNAGDLT